MLISKFNLYNPEWLELVFNNRNKEYGAYNLRQHYARNMVMAMGIAFFSVAVLFGAGILLKAHPSTDRVIKVDIAPVPVLLPPAKEIKKIEPSKPAEPLKAEPPAKPLAMIKDLPPVVKPDDQAEKPVVNADLTKKAIGTEDISGLDVPGNAPAKGPEIGTGIQPVEDVSVHTTVGLDVMPAPIGGEAAWSKFLTKNLRFPGQAQDDRVSGRVFVSFIIEKDGRLSNIIVERGAGHGFDEEALRVLRLAKAWSPGKQNGQPVRVKYTIPINFQISE